MKPISRVRLAAALLALGLASRLSAASDPSAEWYAKIRANPFPGVYFEPQAVDTPATPVVQPVPIITQQERVSDVRLHLIMAVIVETDGTIRKVRMLEASGINSTNLKDFRMGVLRALVACKFHPAMKNGEPVRMVLVLPFDFDPNHPQW
jgi:hypothetical protein